MAPVDYLIQADPELARAIRQVGSIPDHGPSLTSHYAALARIVVGQQLSSKVASTIWGRVAARFGEEPSPKVVLETPVEELRTLGLSGAKASYLHALAEHLPDGMLPIEDIQAATNEEV